MMLDFLSGEVVTKDAPRILDAYREFEGVDDPDHIRWRATWHRSYNTGLPVGLELTPYPVVRKTPCGAWVDPLAYRQATKQPWEDGAPGNEWLLSDKKMWKFVHDGSGSAWAKPTRAAALRSLGVRLTRWSSAVRRDVERVNAACDVAEVLLTTDSWKDEAEHAMFFRDDGRHGAVGRHKIVLADEDSPLAVALRRLRYQYARGNMEKCDHVEAVLAALEGKP
jgi:hypothetical protein